MFNARIVTSVILLLLLAGFVWGMVSVFLPPRPDRIAEDSYSGSVVGHRAIFELLDRLGHPVRRSTDAPALLFAGECRVLLLEPSLYALGVEKDYLKQMGRWIRDGGEVVFVGTHLSRKQAERFREDIYRAQHGEGSQGTAAEESESRTERTLGKDTLLKEFGVGDVSTMEEKPPTALVWRNVPLVEDSTVFLRKPEKSYSMIATGSLAYLGEEVKSLALPGETLARFTGLGMDAAAGRIEVELEPGRRVPIVLEYATGKGHVTLVSEPTLLSNLGIGKDDNAVLAYRLATGPSNRPVIIDEYYHGFMPQSDIRYLMAVWPYSVILLSILVTVALWVWSNVVRFGPPVAEWEVNRRNVLEYVDAMARLFRRGRQYAFVLATCRSGVLDAIREELGLAHGSADAVVLRHLAQRAPERARAFEAILADVRQALARPANLTVAELVRLQERMDSCRMTMRPTPSAPAQPKSISPTSTAAH